MPYWRPGWSARKQTPSSARSSLSLLSTGGCEKRQMSDSTTQGLQALQSINARPRTSVPSLQSLCLGFLGPHVAQVAAISGIVLPPDTKSVLLAIARCVAQIALLIAAEVTWLRRWNSSAAMP
jgi:hypothetical protein